MTKELGAPGTPSWDWSQPAVHQGPGILGPSGGEGDPVEGGWSQREAVTGGGPS